MFVGVTAHTKDAGQRKLLMKLRISSGLSAVDVGWITCRIYPSADCAVPTGLRRFSGRRGPTMNRDVIERCNYVAALLRTRFGCVVPA